MKNLLLFLLIFMCFTAYSFEKSTVLKPADKDFTKEDIQRLAMTDLAGNAIPNNQSQMKGQRTAFGRTIGNNNASAITKKFNALARKEDRSNAEYIQMTYMAIYIKDLAYQKSFDESKSQDTSTKDYQKR